MWPISKPYGGQRLLGLNPGTLMICALFALCYAAIPWPNIFESIYGHPMIDRRVYEVQILTRNLSIDYLRFDSWMSFITGEYLWQIALKYLNRQLGLSPDAIFGGISFITLFAFSITTARVVGLPWIMLLLNPLVVDFAFSQLRLALAVGLALILISFYLNKPLRAASAVVILSMIHTASILFFFLGSAAKAVTARTAWARTYVAVIPLVLSGMVVSILIGPARGTLLSYAGDRRAAYHDMSSTGLYLAFWVGLLFVLIYRWKTVAHRFETAFAVAILSVVATNLVTGGYSTRFIVAAFPFMIISMASLAGIYRSAVLFSFGFYALYQWLYWLRLLG